MTDQSPEPNFDEIRSFESSLTPDEQLLDALQDPSELSVTSGSNQIPHITTRDPRALAVLEIAKRIQRPVFIGKAALKYASWVQKCEEGNTGLGRYVQKTKARNEESGLRLEESRIKISNEWAELKVERHTAKILREAKRTAIREEDWVLSDTARLIDGHAKNITDLY
jgi:hypothetical protein